MTLHDSFGKFNFLDSDAAVRLSVETSRERIGKDLAQLLLGAEAVKTLDRFDRVLREISSTRKMTAREAAAQEQRGRDARKRLEELRQAPRESDEQFRKLEASLGGVGWVEVPRDKGSIDGLEDALETSVVNFRLLRDAGRGFPRNRAELERLLRETRQGIERTTALFEERKKVVREQALEKERDDGLVVRETELGALLALVTSGIEEQASRLSALRASVGSLAGVVPDVESAVARLSEGNVADCTLGDAIASCTGRVGEARENEARAREALREFESKQDVLHSLKQRLAHGVQEVLSHTGDTARCPVCGTAFDEGEVIERVRVLLRGEGEGEGTALRDAVEVAGRELEVATTELNVLDVLRRAMPGSPGMALAGVLAEALALRQRLQSEEVELGSLERKIESLEERGIAVGRLAELRGRTGLEEGRISAEAVEEALRGVRRERQRMAGVGNEISARLASLDSQWHQEAEAWAGAGVSEGDLIATLEARAERIGEASAAIETLADLLRLPTSTSDAILERSLARASELVTELRSALAQEEANAAMRRQEAEGERDAVDSLAGLRVRLKRLKAAENLVEELLAEHSEEALREEVLRNNATEIASTFARLHAPNEFDLGVEGGQLQIARRSDGAEIELNEMSSGQRAAYALSLFLAMNESLRNGPKVILFDDPVAHIDDINTLSFLDYLREVALSGSRQLFFATADAQLAGLFKHKFRFLGDERFRVFDLARAERSRS